MSSHPLVLIERGGAFEALQRGWVVVSNAAGDVVFHWGEPHVPIYSRSALKPFQALPLVLSSAATHFQLSAQELAVICSSHGGEDFHCQTVQALLHKASLTVSDLQCGAHLPLHEPTALALQTQQILPTALHNNCSGKHAGMLLQAVYHGWPLATYLERDHPVQINIFDALQRITCLSCGAFHLGWDGCSAPNYSFPLSALATAYARLLDPVDLSESDSQGLATLAWAMIQHPLFIAGHDRLDTALMVACPGLIAKSGAAGLLAMALPERGLGVAIKIENGTKEWLSLIALKLLQHLGVLSATIPAVLEPWNESTLYNCRQRSVGHVTVLLP